MLSLSIATRIFVALEPVDMRQNFNGLYARVQSVLQQDPLSGHFFVFTNRSRTRQGPSAGPPGKVRAAVCVPKN